ncbi:hypothetical protein [Nocardiopsis oceani]
MAKAAGASRTTLQQHFADRAELLAATTGEANRAIDSAVSLADTANGGSREALGRLIGGLVGAGDHMLFLFGSYATTEGGEEGQEEDGEAESDSTAVIDLVRRGQDEGVFTADLDAKWIENAAVVPGLRRVRGEQERHRSAPRHRREHHSHARRRHRPLSRGPAPGVG